MTKRRRISYLSSHSHPGTAAPDYLQMLHWFQEWPTIEALIYRLHPSIARSKIETCDDLIDYVLEKLGITSTTGLFEPKSLASLQADTKIGLNNLEAMRYWIDQWSEIEPILCLYCPSLNTNVISAFGDLLRAIGDEVVAVIEVFRIRRSLVIRSVTA